MSNDQLDTPLGAMRRCDIAALHQAINRFHEPAHYDRALTEACETGFLEGVRVLFERASPAWKSRNAFLKAAENGHTRVTLYLLRKSCPFMLDRCTTGAHLSSLSSHIETTKALIRFHLSKGPEDESERHYLIMSACRIGDAHLTRLLLAAVEGYCPISLQVAIGNRQMECAALIWKRADPIYQERKRYLSPKDAEEMDAWNDRVSLQHVSSTRQLQATRCRRL